eukprot:c37973_g1_i1 orf=58-246(+)
MVPVPWTKDYQIETANKNTCLVWIVLPFLPIQSRPYVEELAAIIGKVVYVEKPKWIDRSPHP